MRITRSGLRRIIAEESARILAEANDERVPGGHQARIAAGFEDEPAEVDFEDEDMGEEAERGEKVLHVLSLGRGLRFVVADDIDVDIDEDEGVEDVTEEIVDAEGESSPESLLSWLEAHPEVGVVHDDDYEMSENDASAYMEELRRLIELGAGEDDGFDDGGEGYDDGGDEYLEEGEGKKHHMSPRQRLTAYLEAVGAGGVVDTVMAAIDAAIARAEQEGADVTSEDVTFNLSNEDLDAIPRGHAVRWHNMLNAVLDDEIDPEAFADAEAHRRDIEDTERDLSRPSNFLEEGEGGDYDYGYEDEPEAEMGDPEDPYGDLPKGERPRGGLVHTAGFKGGSPAGALLRRRGGEDLSEARWAKLAGILKG